MITAKMVNILLIEDNPGDARLIAELLKEVKLFSYHLSHCETLKSGVIHIQNEPVDVILLDLNLPDSTGQETFDTLYSWFPDIPVILVSGVGDEELSLKLIHQGAQDYINKGEIVPRIIERSVSYSLERNKLRMSLIEELSNRKIAEKEIQKQYSILNAIINNSHSVIIFFLDKEYRYLGFNENHRKEMKKIYNADIEQGMNLLNLITIPEIREKAKSSIDRVLAGETFIETQFQPEVEIYYEFHWNTVWKEDDIIGVSCFILDITNRILIEAALKASEEKYRILVETAMSGIYVSQLTGELLFANKAFCKILGYDSVEEINKKGIVNTYQDKNDRDSFIENLKELHRVINYELRLATKSGTIRTGLFSACLEGETITGTVIDITELVNAKEQAEHSDRLKTAFMNNISHEIRTPLNGILGFSSLIRQQGLTQEEKDQFGAHIIASSTRLLNTINNYMDISMIVSGNLEIKKRNVNPVQILESLLGQFQPICVMKNLNLQLIIPGNNKNLTLNSDNELFRKAISHLLNNAIKFTRRGEITFGYNIKPGSLEFFVKDTGIGIGKEAKSMIFGNFVQEELSDTRGYEGSGLGLSIAQGIVTLLGSEIRLTSEKGKGSTFTFDLPIETRENEFSDIKTIKVPIPASEKPVILIAEDDESNQTYLEIILKKAGVELILASNGKEAVERCRHYPEISLVLMDVKMPLMDGLEATQEIKSFRKDLPVVAVTAFAMSGDEKKAREAGCDDYIAKPVNQQLLLEKLKKFGIYGNE